MNKPKIKRILVIRRDNIGDLVCTTPLFSALRRNFPEARVEALVNSYNAPVLFNNQEIDQTHIYRKAKHRAPGESRFGIWLETCGLIRRLRNTHFDLIIVAPPGHQPSALKFARWIGAKRIVAYTGNNAAQDSGHEAERVMRLLWPIGIKEQPGPLRLTADPALASTISIPAVTLPKSPLVGLHISARKPLQRWPIERFSELAHRLHARHGARFLLFWSPGAENHPQHPGDDEKAARLLALCNTLPIAACKTEKLEELIAGLSLCDRVICSDGGAMHLAAGLGKPMVCFFGNSGADRWHPWGVKHELLQPESRKVTDISVDDALAAYERLEQQLCAAI